MLASDLLINVRASRDISADQVLELERMVFAAGAPSRDQLDLLLQIDTYLQRSDPGWAKLLSRAAHEARPQATDASGSGGRIEQG
jgi:hypothetical protein